MRFLRQKTSFSIAENIIFHVRKQHFPKLELLFYACGINLYGFLFKPSTCVAFQCFGHHTSGYFQIVRCMRACKKAQAVFAQGAMVVVTEYVPVGHVCKVKLFFSLYRHLPHICHNLKISVFKDDSKRLWQRGSISRHIKPYKSK